MKAKVLITLLFTPLIILSACTGGDQAADSAMSDYNIMDTPDMAGIEMMGSMEERFSEQEQKWIYADLRMAIIDAGINDLPGLEAGRLGADNQEQGRKNAEAMQGQMMINVISTIADKYNISTLELRALMQKGLDNMWPETTKDLTY